MDVKKIALLVGALVIAVVTAVMAKNMFTGAGAEAANNRACLLRAQPSSWSRTSNPSPTRSSMR